MPFQSSPSTGPLCLPLSKFSYATVSGDGVSPIPWIHLSSNNLFAVLETIRIEDAMGKVEERRKFRVLQDPEVMEDIDLDTLTEEARKSVEEARRSVSQTVLPAITVVVKAPCIAIRYPLAGGQVRRFQIRFTSTEDYYDAMKVFSRAQVPSTEAGAFPSARPPTRPSTARSSILQPSDSVSNIGSRPVSLSSVQYGHDVSGAAPSPSPGWASTRTMKPSNSSSSAPRSIFNNSTRPFAIHIDRAPTQPNSHVLPVAGDARMDSENGRPTGYRAQQEPVQQPINLYRPRPSTAALHDTENPSQMLPPRRELPFERPASSRAPRPSTAATNGTDTSSRYFTRSSSIASGGADITAATDEELSPLPTSVGTASKRKRAAAVRTPATSVENDSSKSKPPASVTAAKKSRAPSRRKKSGKAAAEDVVVPSVDDILRRLQESGEKVDEAANAIDTQALFAQLEERREKKVCGTTSKYGTSHDSEQQRAPPSANHRPASPANATKNQPLDIIEDSTAHSHLRPGSSNTTIPARPPLTELNSNSSTLAPATTTTTTITTPTIHPPKPLPPTAPAHPTPQLNPHTLLTLTQTQTQAPTFANPTNIDAWAALPTADRDAAIETFICQQIENDSFLQLCQTMEGTWQTLLIK